MTSKEALEHIVNNDYNTIITTYPSQEAYNGLTKKEMVEIIEKDLDKLSQLEDIEEELSIDLITLFKALKNGFYAYKDNHIVEMKSHKGNCGTMNFYASYDCIIAEDVFEQQYIYLLKDYGKTWALTKEELENNK